MPLKDYLLHPIFESRKVRILWIIGIAIIYFDLAELGLSLAFQNTNASPVWPPSGFALTILLIYGRRLAPGIFVGAFCGNVATFIHNNPELSLTPILTASLFIALGNTCEALLGNFLFRRLIKSDNPIGEVKNIYFFAFIALVMCMLGGTMGTLTLCISQMVPWSLFQTVWYTWVLGDATGVIILSPFLISWLRKRQTYSTSGRPFERILLFTLLIVAGYLIFGQQSGINDLYSRSYLIIPFLLWVVLRFGQREVTTALILTSSLAIWGTINNSGLLTALSLNQALITLQSFVCVITIMILVFTAAYGSLRNAEQALLNAQNELEKKVNERTAELADANHSLQSEIDERRSAELRINKFNLALSKSNAELAKFAYVASHDLKTPLRSISYLVDFIEKDFKGDVGESIRENFHEIKIRAQRMDALINGILEYSKVGKEILHEEEIDIRQLIEEVKNLLPEITGMKIIVQQNIPCITAPKIRLLQVFQNLISNALKHHHRKEGIVRIDYADKESFHEFSVADDGPGIDPQYHEKIYDLFQTLDPKDVTESTGIGLSIVRKVIEENGGRIRIESELGKGTKFIFSWPKS